MRDGIVHVVALFSVRPERIDAFREQASRTLVEPTQREAGCIRYELCQDLGDPSRFAMIESWESEESLQRHLAQESLQAAVAGLAPMAAGPPTVHRFRPVG